MPSSSARGARPRFNAPITDVVMPEECQSMPITAPSAWNQKGSLRRERNAEVPYSWTMVSVMAVPSSGHPFGEPLGDPSAVQRKVGDP